ncbi:hypothetical protein [Nocardia altamirensis]|uniref:hypothetical protein n=1 Tax=Nocardia altamirensis TaxID=472158 RepID=UPI00114D2B47|nr:hypothetical protein [Nocardia altamirensis]
MPEAQPESNTPPPQPPSRRSRLRWTLNLLEWVRTAVTVYTLLTSENTVGSAIETITEPTVRVLVAILGLGN